MKKAIIVLFLALLQVSFSTDPEHFTYTTTNKTMTIRVLETADLTLDGTALADGDEIGVFTQDGVCVGAMVWEESSTSFNVYGKTTTPPVDGLEEGESMKFRVWDASESTEHDSVSISLEDYEGNPTDDEFDTSAPYKDLVELEAYSEPDALDAPTLSLPTDEATNLNTSFTFYWLSVSGATSYDIQVSENDTFSTFELNTNTSDTSKSISGLDNSTTYYWRVRAVNSDTTSEWSAIWEFTTKATVCSTQPVDTDGNGYRNISTICHLRWISQNTAARNYNLELDNNIDASDTENWNVGDHDNDSMTPDSAMGWDPIDYFNGNFNGNGYKIKNLYINRPGFDRNGFFGTISNDTVNIKNFGLENVNITGKTYNAAIVGHNKATIEKCYADGNIKAHGNDLGGIVGFNTGTLTQCYSRVDLDGTDQSNRGGVFGVNWSGGNIDECYSTGEVTGTGSSYGGFGGVNFGSVTDSYWDKETSGRNTSNGGIGKTTEQMKTESTFTDWDFDETWKIDSTINDGYPYLTLFVVEPLDQVTLIFPEDEAVDQSKSITLKWHSISDADYYDLQVSENPTFSTIKVNTNTYDTTRYVSSLNYSTKYYWRVRARNADTIGVWSAVWEFTTESAPLDRPILEYPDDEAIDMTTSFTFVWNTVDRADDYDLNVSESPTFSTLIIDTTTSDTSKYVSGLRYSTNYYWKVRAKNSDTTSEWSTVWVFTTEDSTSTHFTYTTTNKTMTIRVLETADLTLDGTALADGDEIGVFTQDGVCVGAMVWEESSTSFNVYGKTTTPPVDGLEEGESMKFRVWDASESTEHDSVSISLEDYEGNPTDDEFDTSAPYKDLVELEAYSEPDALDAPELSYPADESTNRPVSLTLKWKSVAEADNYDVQLSEEDTFSSFIVNTNTSDTSKAVSDLDYNTTYYWRVRAKNADTTSEWSSVWEFTTEDSTSTHFTYTTTNKTMTIRVLETADLTLDGTALADGDEIGVFTQDGVCVGAMVWEESSTSFNVYGKTTTPPVDGLEEGESMKFRVWDESESTEHDSVSISLKDYLGNPTDDEFDTSAPYKDLAELEAFSEAEGLDAPLLVSPTDLSTDESINNSLIWNSVSGADNYDVQLSEDDTFSSFILNTNTSDTSKAVSDLDYNTTYYWRARAKNSSETSDWSTVWEFTTRDSSCFEISKNINVRLFCEGLWDGSEHEIIAVMVELRSGDVLMTSTVESREAGVIDEDGYVDVDFGDLDDGDYWMVVRVSGYLPVAAPSKISLSESGLSYDFTDSSDKSVMGAFAMVNVSSEWLIRAGDLDKSASVGPTDINKLVSNFGKNVSTGIPSE